MHITRRKTLRIRMGDYESFEFSAEVGVTHRDFGIADNAVMTDADLAEVFGRAQTAINEQLDAALADDINDAVELTTDRKSFLAQAYAPQPLTRTTRRER